jgi:hypothetical protein
MRHVGWMGTGCNGKGCAHDERLRLHNHNILPVDVMQTRQRASGRRCADVWLRCVHWTAP